MHRKMLQAVSFLLVLSLGLVGCGGAEKNRSQPAAGASPTGAKSVQDTLLVGSGGDAVSLDPSIVFDSESLKVSMQIFDTLLSFKEGTTEVQPSLAEGYNISEDGMKYTFTLKKGVTFHDGTDFNADAVVFNFVRWNDPNSPYKFEGDSFGYFDFLLGDANHRVIKEITTVDDYTVEFTLNQPHAPFLEKIALPVLGIASPTAVKEKKEKFKEEPVGSGPFVFKEWKRNESITVEKNQNFWQAGYPKLNKVIFRVIPDNSARLNALKTGEIDLMDGLNPDDSADIKKEEGLQLLSRPPLNVAWIGFNLKKAPFDHPKVRQALNHAVNKEAIIQAFYAGSAKPAINALPPDTWGYNSQVKDYGYDLEKAKALLAEAGYPQGLDQEVVLYALPISRPYMPDGRKMAEAIQAEFAKIGVKVKIESPEWAVYLQDLAKGDKFDMFMLGWVAEIADPDSILYPLFDKEGIGSTNYSSYQNPAVDSLLEGARKIVDQTKRTEMYKEAQELIRNDAPWIPLVHAPPLLAAQSSLKGYVLSSTVDAFTNVYFE